MGKAVAKGGSSLIVFRLNGSYIPILCGYPVLENTK